LVLLLPSILILGGEREKAHISRFALIRGLRMSKAQVLLNLAYEGDAPAQQRLLPIQQGQQLHMQAGVRINPMD
jgi:hypothetical protein